MTIKRYSERSAPTKIAINHGIAARQSLVMEKNGEDCGKTVLLDAPDMMRSTHAVVEDAGFKGSVHIAEIHKPSAVKMNETKASKGKLWEKVVIFCGCIGAMMAAFRERVSFAFYDFHEARLKPHNKEAIKAFFRNATDYAIMTLTFAVGRGGGKHGIFLRILKCFIAKTAKETGKEYTICNERKYTQETESDGHGQTMWYADVCVGEWKTKELPKSPFE
jgi:hypothetical protein